MEDIVLSETSLDPDDHDIVKKTETYCLEKVEALLDKAGECPHENPTVRESMCQPNFFCNLEFQPIVPFKSDRQTIEFTP